jgi:hypothetical protein
MVVVALVTDMQASADVSMICSRELPESVNTLNTIQVSHEFRTPSNEFL